MHRVSFRAWFRRAERLLSFFGRQKPPFRCREEFRAPAGVRKSPRKEPAGHRRWLWGFRFSADVGDGATAAAKLWGECGQTASLRLRAVLSGRWAAGRGCVGVDDYHQVTLRWFLASIVALLAGVLLAGLTASHVLNLRSGPFRAARPPCGCELHCRKRTLDIVRQAPHVRLTKKREAFR